MKTKKCLSVWKKSGRSLSVFLILIFALTAPGQTPRKTILILGDSLTEGFGVAKDAAFPAVLEKLLNEREPGEFKVINGGIGGSTSASALPRLRWSLRAQPEIVVLALGANDGLRGLDLKVTEENLRQAIAFARQKKVKVVLAGMKLPPNYGEKYARQFEQLYRKLAQEFQLPLIPFLLEGVGGKPDKNLPDGIHPNEEGHKIIARTVKDFIMKQL
jgi:acyl-CoA thioesterase-1